MAHTPSPPEAWLRGPLPGFDPLLMPVAHAFTQAREDILRLAATLSIEALWDRPGTAASVGYHLMHIAGSTDRLLTYARGEMLSPEQMAALQREGTRAAELTAAALADTAVGAIDRALEQVRATDPRLLLEPRAVGRARLPATVIGLLFHAAEHATRHVGQAITTAKSLSGAAGR